MTSIAIASDHAGFTHKEAIRSHLESKGILVVDFGTNSIEPVDYPDYIRAAAKAVANGQTFLGIILGGSGNEAIVANKIRGIRCAVVWNTSTARLSKEHGDCNMIAIGQRMVTEQEALSIVDTWLSSKFKGGRHLRRINKIDE